MNKRRKRKKRIIRLGIAGIFLAVILAVFFLFRVRTVSVYGNDMHLAEEISAGLINDTFTKNTLYLLWEYRDGEVPDTLPFLNSLQIQMKSPSQIEVVVQEKKPVGYLDKGSCVYFDRDGLVIQITDEASLEVPIITGVTTEEPVLYKKLPTESSAQLRTILSLTQLLEYHELDAKEIRFSENMEITVFIKKIQVNLGQDEYLEEKVANLKSILGKLSEEESGILHLESFTGGAVNVTFSPSDEVESVIPDETEAVVQTEDTEQSDDADGADTKEDGVPEDTKEDGASEDTTNASSGGDPFMAFDSSGTLRYDVRVVNGVAVDSYGNPVPGCTVNENGYVVDAYMNVIDPATGQPIQ